MLNNEDFKNKILTKYPNALINIDEKGHAMAFNQKNGTTQILGCILCFDNRDVRMMKNKVVIQEQDAIPITSIVEDDSLNPALKSLFLCPICSRIIVHPNISTLPIPSRSIEDWKD